MQPRKTQKERREQTRAKIMRATLDCIHEYGYYGTTMPRILEKAGVSRGAWSHHFKTKKELIAEAAREALFAASLKNAAEMGAQFLNNAQVPALFDYIWHNFYQGKVRDIWVELTVACRTDVELRDLLAPVFSEFVATLDALWKSRFQSRQTSDIPVEKILNLTLYVIGGMGLQSILHDNANYYNSLRKIWTQMILPLLEIKE